MSEAAVRDRAGQSKAPERAAGPLGRWVARIPERRVRRLGSLLGGVIYRLDVPHRRIVRRNLGLAYPDWPERRIRQTSERVFENIGTALLEILQLRFLGAADIAARVRIEGRENLAAALASPGGVVFISAHLGNWELAPLLVASAFKRPMALVARRVRPRLLDRWVTDLRTRFGSRVIDKRGGLAQMVRSLRGGMPLGLLIDQGTKRSEGVKVRFFGHAASATPAAAMLALRCRCPVYPAFTLRREGGGFVTRFLPAVDIQRTSDLRADLEANTRKMAAIIEEAVRAHPEQWFWVNKRWKHYHPDLYPEHQARRRRRRLRKAGRREASAAEDGRERRKA